MKLLSRCMLGLAALLVMAASAQAHFLWVLTNDSPNGSKIQVFFGESAKPDDPALLDKVSNAEVWVLPMRGEPKALSLTKMDEALQADVSSPNQTSAIVLRHTYGVVEKGGSAFLLKYYGKTYPSALPGTWREIKDAERLPLEVIPKSDGSATTLRVIWKGEPLAGATVTIVGPGIEQKLEGITDASGNFRCELLKAGVFSIRAKHVEAASGTHDGTEFKEVRHYSTLALRSAPSRLSPLAHRLPALPKGMTSFGGAIVGDSLFVFGGNYGSAHEYNGEDQSGDLWRLDLKNAATWAQFPIGPKLQGLAMVEHRGQLYRVGGFTALNKPGDQQDIRSQADFARLNPAKKPAWESLPNLPEPRSSHDVAVVGDTLYVVGGWTLPGGGKDSKWRETALACHLAGDKIEWKTIAAPPFRRRALALAAHNGKLFCIGGMQEQGGPTTAVATYDPQTNAWSEGPALQGSGMDGFGAAAFACDGSLFVTTMSGSIQRLSNDGKMWEFVGQLAHPRFFHRVLSWHDSKLVVVGGASMSTGKTEELELLPIAELKTAAK